MSISANGLLAKEEIKELGFHPVQKTGQANSLARWHILLTVTSWRPDLLLDALTMEE
jgi:hypothetical protein